MHALEQHTELKKLVKAALSPQFSLQDAGAAILAFGQKAEALYAAAQPQAAPTKSTKK